MWFLSVVIAPALASLAQSSVWKLPSVPGAVGEFPTVTLLEPNVGFKPMTLGFRVPGC